MNRSVTPLKPAGGRLKGIVEAEGSHIFAGAGGGRAEGGSGLTKDLRPEMTRGGGRRWPKNGREGTFWPTTRIK